MTVSIISNGCFIKPATGGSGGFLGLGIWRYRTETDSNPDAGQLQFDNATVADATELYVHAINDSGADMSAFLDLLSEFDLIYIQVQVDASQFVTLQIGTPSLAASVYTFPISQIQAQGATPSNNTEVAVVIERDGVGSGVTDHGALTGLADDDHPQYIQGIEVSNEGGAPLATLANALDFVGTGVDASGVGAEKTITFDYLDPDVTDNLTVGYTTDVEADTLTAGTPKTLDPVCTLEYFKTVTVDDDFTLNVPSGGNGHCEYVITVDSNGPYTLTAGNNVKLMDGNVTMEADGEYILNIHRYSATKAIAQLTLSEGSIATQGITVENQSSTLATLATTIDFVGDGVVATGVGADKTVTISGTDADAIHDNVANEIKAITDKPVPVSGDHYIIEDSADSDNKKSVEHSALESLFKQKTSITVTSTPYPAAAIKVILVDDDTIGGAATVDLPAAASSTDENYNIVKMGTTATVTIDPDSGASETINGAATRPLNSQYESVEAHCDGTNWVIL